MHALGHLDLLGPNVVLIPEGEATAHKAIHDDAHGPDINLGAVVPVEELGGPEDLGADPGAQPLLGPHVEGRAEVGEDDPTLLVGHVLAIHQVVVTLDVAMDHCPAVEVLDARAHLPGHVHDVVAHDLPSLLEMPLQALYQVAPAELVHDDTDEAPLVEDAMHLHDVRVVHGLHHLRLLFDRIDRGLHLVHHLNCELLTG
mmetsp:Transcript_60680/g.159541  ORF Transcript_60680/g.159541 Transcript_60680/m.159541 type:complete len:200 (+) Transcript_60680:1844-2443(+)